MSIHAVAQAPTSNQPPHGARGRRLLGPAALRTCPFASLLSQVRARLGPGGYCRRSGNGSPQTCLPAACGVAQVVALYGLSSSTQAQDPREGPSLAGRTMQGFLRSGLTRQAREGGGEIKARGTSRGSHDASHDDQGCQAGASPRSVLPFLFGAKGASAGESIKQRHPFWCNETKTSTTAGRKSLWSPSQRHH